MISIKVDGVDSLLNRLALAPRQIEIATQRAMLKTAHQIKDAEKSEMQRVFDRPTRWTIGSMQVKVVRNMEIKVGIVDPEGAYKRAQSYLGTQVEGGARRQKAMERALAGAGLLPPGWYTVPGAGAKLDQYGNMSVGQIKQILSWFDAANRSAGSQQNMGQAGRDRRRKGTRTRVGFEYVAIVPGRGSKLTPGIYQRFFFGMGRSIKPILIFVSGTRYKPRFDFGRVAQQTYDRVWPVEAAAAIQREIEKL